MRQQDTGECGFAVLDAAIILIGIVIVAAVLISVLGGPALPDIRTGAGGSEPAKTIEVAGDVYGLAADPSSGISEIRYSIRLVPGAPSMNLTTMKIVFSTPSTGPVTLSWGTKASASVFTARFAGTGEPAGTLEQGRQVEIDFFVADVSAGSRMNIDMRPMAGALSFSRTAPALITRTNVL